jgi:spermidine/putrescine transport system substrate-binding protein
MTLQRDDEPGPAGGWTRAQILRRAGALGLSASAAAGLLAACGGDEGSPATTSDANGAGAELEDELNVFAWAQEWEFAVEPFEKETGVKVNLKFRVSDADDLAVLRANPGQHDVMSLNPAGPGDLIVRAGLVEELDVARLEHLDDMHSALVESTADRYGGKLYAVPFYWGTTPMARRTDISPATDSWTGLADPVHKGKVGLEDSHVNYYIAALVSGFPIEDTSEENLGKASDFFKGIFPNLRTFWSSGTDIKEFFARGDVGIANITDGLARDLIKGGKPVEMIFPTEGLGGWIDGPAVLKEAEHPNAAYAWANFVSRPEWGAKLANEFSFVPANGKSIERLDAATKKLLQADKLDEAAAGLRFWTWDEEQSRTLLDWWQGLKLEAGV